MSLGSLRRWLYLQLEASPTSGEGMSALNKIIALVIAVAGIAAILETEPTILAGNEALFDVLELTFVVVFIVEYIARLWIAPDLPQYAGRRFPRLRYLVSWPALIDLAAILPVLLLLLGPGTFLLRLLRLARLLRFAKLARLGSALNYFLEAIHSRRTELLVSLCVGLLLLIFCSTVLFIVEGKAQPEHFGSIPRAMWWAVVTLTTVGYGDAVPITPLGRVCAGLTAIAGIIVIALPTGILAAAFSDVLRRKGVERPPDRRGDG